MVRWFAAAVTLSAFFSLTGCGSSPTDAAPDRTEQTLSDPDQIPTDVAAAASAISCTAQDTGSLLMGDVPNFGVTCQMAEYGNTYVLHADDADAAVTALKDWVMCPADDYIARKDNLVVVPQGGGANSYGKEAASFAADKIGGEVIPLCDEG